MITAEKLKTQVKTKANKNNSQPQDVMQMYFFERLLYRISISKYKHNFILKGGLLLSAIFGDERRTTQDMDAMIKGIELDFDLLKKIIEEIVIVELDDEIKYEVLKYKDIREEDKYGGIKIFLMAYKEHLKVPLSIDISINDPITPRELEFKYKCMFDDKYINIMTYTIETIIAEKFQTLIEDTIGNTRAKDFYDLYVLLTENIDDIDKEILIMAIKNTFKRRETSNLLSEIDIRFEEISKSEILENSWAKYRNTHKYANEINYQEIIEAITMIVDLLAHGVNI